MVSKAQRTLRGRWHDLNSQRRYRGQKTVGWEQYKKATANGTRQYKKGQVKMQKGYHY